MDGGVTTLKQIGESLGLSAATVSRALNGFPEVNASTRQRVEAAARALNYRPNQIARKLSSGRSNIVALVVQRPKTLTSDTTFFGVVSSISEALAKMGFSLILHVGSGDDELEAYRNLISAGTVDGFIINAPRADDPRIALLEAQGAKFVVHGRSHRSASYPFYDVDNAEVSRLAAGLLLDLGHRRIALLNGPADLAYAQDRLDGFRSTLAGRGVSVPDAFVFHGPLSETAGYAAALAALGGARGASPTAFICASTLTARGVYRALAEKNMTVPGDVSVVAHDDDVPDIVASSFSPSLSVTWSPLTNACEPLAELLVTSIEDRGTSKRSTVEQPELIARASVGPARDQKPW